VALVLAIGGLVFMKSGKSKRDAQIVTELAAEAEKPGTTEIKVNSATIQLLLRSTINNESDSELQKIGRVLSLAKATDGTDVDERIAAFATKGPEISVRAKAILISEALRIRNNPSILPSMMDLLGSSDSSALKIAALQAIRQMTDDRQFDTFLQIIERTTDNPVRLAAEQNIVEILRKSGDVEGLAKKLKLSQESSVKSEVQQSLQRLIGFSSSIKPAGR
jgi:hypothetical protein